MLILYGSKPIYPTNKTFVNGSQLRQFVLKYNPTTCFWCRNLTGNNKLCSREVRFIHKNNEKIALISGEYFDLIRNPEKVTESIHAAESIGTPPNCKTALYVDVRLNHYLNLSDVLNLQRQFENAGYKFGILHSGYLQIESKDNLHIEEQCVSVRNVLMYSQGMRFQNGMAQTIICPNSTILETMW